MSPTEQKITSEKGKNLFDYFSALVNLRIKHTLDYQNFEESMFLSDIPRKAGCNTIAWGRGDRSDDTVWIEIEKPKRRLPPKVPEELKIWVDATVLGKFEGGRPAPLQKAVEQDSKKSEAAGVPITFLDWSSQEHLHGMFERYCEEQWIPWAQEERRIADVQEAFAKLYSFHQKQQRLGEAYEVVMGFGLLRWNSGARVLRRHVLTTPCSITFDLKREIMTVSAATNGLLKLETDWLQHQEKPTPELEDKLSAQAAEIGEAVWDQFQVHDVLRAWVTSVSSKAAYKEELEYLEGIYEDPQCFFSPALLLRKRTQKNLLATFKHISDSFAAGLPTSPALNMALGGAQDGPTSYDSSDHPPTLNSTPVRDSEIYFPLPSNEQQDEIIRRLEGRPGVLVQGPPGTGKSHTIANLICHLLATGKKVLITSQSARALEVLKEKIPTEISPLCVCVMADDRASLELLEDSVQGITSKYNNWDERQNAQSILEAEGELAEVRRLAALTEAEILTLKERSSFKHPKVFGNYEGTEQEIALMLENGRVRFEWLKAYFDGTAESGIALSGTELGEYISLTTQLEGHSTEFTVPEAEYVPSREAFLDLVRQERSAKAALEEFTISFLKDVSDSLEGAAPTDVQGLAVGLTEIQSSLGTLRNHVTAAWAVRAATDVLTDKDRRWRHLLEASKLIQHRCRSIDPAAAKAVVEGVSTSDLSAEELLGSVIKLIEHLQKGKRFLIWPFIFSNITGASYITKRIRVDGLLCNKIPELNKLRGHLELSIALKQLSREWEGIVEVPQRGTLLAYQLEFEDLLEPLELASALGIRRIETQAFLKAIVGLPEPPWHDPEGLRLYSNSVKRNLASAQLKAVRNSLLKMAHQLEAKLDSGTHPVFSDLLHAINNRDISRFEECSTKIAKARRLLELSAKRAKLEPVVRAASKAMLVEMASGKNMDTWVKLAESFDEAAAWLNTCFWIERRNQASYARSLESKSDSCRGKERTILSRLAGLKAWRHCFLRMEESERRALVAWAQAVKKIGRGTGKGAIFARKAAQTYMEQCRSAIPAWVMPIYRVAESITPQSEMFDVVIVDEASQCGPEALFLTHIGKQIIVVGDDKQISPEAVGVEIHELEALKAKYLKDLPFNYFYGGSESSLFGLADILFKDRIRLREHFRCMPEIIQFSNALSYSSEPLIPLKQFGGERLSPTVSARYVAGAIETGDKVKSNSAEAEAIISFIESAIADPLYKAKSIGVISLVGESSGQIDLINKLITKRINPKEIEERKILCGTPYSFQGDERDVICLGMVVAPRPGKAIYAATKDSQKKRYNVAASRAKEQMILFHSVTEHDLSENDLRYQLLTYCQNPKIVPLFSPDPVIYSLKKYISETVRARGNQPAPFDSWFEVDVFMRIVDRGYRAVPQYEIAGKRMDIVIDGPKGRIAVECDGDEWHGPENALADFRRQRMLERCKFKFWRVLGSEFYLNQERAMESLWRLLEALGVSNLRGISEATSEPVLPKIPTQVNVVEDPSAGEVLIPDASARTAVSTSSQVEALEPKIAHEATTQAIFQMPLPSLGDPVLPATKELEITPALCKNLLRWNDEARKMTNSRERQMLGRLESAAFFLSKGREVERLLMEKAREAVARAILLGFDPKREYPKKIP